MNYSITDVPNSLHWHAAGWYRAERAIDEAEQFYTNSAKLWEGIGHQYLAITSCVSISIPLEPRETQASAWFENIARSAWRKLREDHPAIAAPVVYDSKTKLCKKVYDVPLGGYTCVEDWVQATLKTIDKGQSGAEFANEDPPLGRYPTIYIVVPPSIDQDSDKRLLRRDIVFRSPHDIIDGIGTLMLFNRLLENISKATSSPIGGFDPTWEYFDLRDLTPPLRIAACVSPSPGLPQLQKLKAIQEANKAARTDAEVLSIPYKAGASMPLDSKRVSLYLSAKETYSIIAKCKECGATPTHAVHAAIALTVRDLQTRTSTKRKAKYISYALINLRQSLKESWSYLDKNPPPPRNYVVALYHGISASHLVVDLTVPSCSTPLPTPQESRDEFLQALSQVKIFYHNAKVDDDYLHAVPSLFRELTPPYSESLCEVPAPNPSPSVSLSSLGVVDKIIRRNYKGRSVPAFFEDGNCNTVGEVRDGFRDIFVDDAWVMGSEYGTGLGLFLKTFQGRMEVSAAYNEAFHDEEEVRGFLKDVKKWVFKGLGVIGDD